MIKRICDRCNKEISGNYWNINIYEKADSTIRVTTVGAINNLKQNTNRIFNQEKEYCPQCIEAIKKYIENFNYQED